MTTPCLLTFDVEDWFQVENLRPLFPPSSWDGIPRRVRNSTRVILDLLAERRLRATFFILGWVAEREPELVHEISRSGHEIACHGYGHVLPMEQGLDEFRRDVLRARRILEDLTGRDVVGYRAPSFSIDRARLDVLSECGFLYDSSLHRFRLHDRYGNLGDLGPPVVADVYRIGRRMFEIGLPVEEFGPFSVPVSGGGYFRLYPGAVFRRLARSSLRRRGHFEMYLHSWEFDPEQPWVRGVGFSRAFRHYQHLAWTLPRMRKLLAMFRDLGVSHMTMREFVETLPAAVSQPTVAGPAECVSSAAI